MPLNADLYFQRGIGRLVGAFSFWGTAGDFAVSRFLEPHWVELYFAQGKAWTEADQPELAYEVWLRGLRQAGTKGSVVPWAWRARRGALVPWVFGPRRPDLRCQRKHRSRPPSGVADRTKRCAAGAAGAALPGRTLCCQQLYYIGIYFLILST